MSAFSENRWLNRIKVRSIGRNPLTTNIVIGLVLTVCGRRISSLNPPAGYDPSWRAGLAMAFNQHLAWGPGVDFTYGPLGFLASPLRYFALTASLAFCYQIVLGVTLFGLLACLLRKHFPLLIAIVLSFAVGTTVIADVEGVLGANDVLIGFAAIIGLLALQDDESPRRSRLIVLGVLCGISVLVKFSDGIAAFGVLGVVIATSRNWRRDVLIGLGSFAATFFLAWIATGNSLENIASFLGNSIAITTGYASAEVLGQMTAGQRWEIAAFLVVLLALGIDSLRGEDFRRITGTVLVLVGICWIVLRESFVREDAAHAQIFFALVLLLVPALRVKQKHKVVLLASILLLGTLCWTSRGEVPSGVRNPVANARSFIKQLTVLAGASRLDTAITNARLHLQSVYAVPGDMLGELEHQSVAIEPFQNEVAWAYPGFRWDPEPVLQSPNAYTSSLDDLDADFLYSRQAPTRILQSPPKAIDGQYAFFEAPSTQIAQMCRYVQIIHDAQWQVLRRVSDRCGPIRKVGSTTAHAGETISVPKEEPNVAVLASIRGIASSLSYRLGEIVFRPPVISIELSANKLKHTYRLVPGTASDLRVMDAPKTLGYAQEYAPMNLTNVAIANPESNSDTYTVTFYVMPMSKN